MSLGRHITFLCAGGLTRLRTPLVVAIFGAFSTTASADVRHFLSGVTTCFEAVLDQRGEIPGFEPLGRNGDLVLSARRIMSDDGSTVLLLERSAAKELGLWSCGLTGESDRPATDTFLDSYRPVIDAWAADAGLKAYYEKIHNVGSFIDCGKEPPVVVRFQTAPGHIVGFGVLRANWFQSGCENGNADDASTVPESGDHEARRHA